VSRTSLFRRAVVAACAWSLFAVAPAPAQLYGSFGKNKIQYRDFDWQIYHSPHFDIYYYKDEENLLEKVASFAESAYDRLSREFDHQIQQSIPLIFYATHSAFEQNNIILNFIPEGIGAFASPVKNRMVLPVDLPDAELFELVMHELTHVFQYEVIFQGKFGRLGGGAPQWFTEGMASYMAKDEGTSAKMYLRDAVVNDRIPSILQRGSSGYMAYRFGHAAFDYIEQRWGAEGFRDFIYEFRNTFGGRADRALQRALKIEPEDFDLDFRKWLRQQYLPELVQTGEPSDFGRPFRDERGDIDQAISPAASPSGDLVASLAVTHGDIDVVLFDAKKRRPIANLTKGFSSDYQYIVSQFLTSKARMGRDLAFSPNGNLLALFVKRERGRSLVLLDVLKKKVERVIDMDVDQQHGPAWSPDGRKVAFSGNRNGQFDIFVVDVASGEVTNLTNDPRYDGAPVYAPDGASLIYTSTVGNDYGQLFRLSLADPSQRTQLTEGEWTDKDAVFSSDGSWLYFTSDRSGADNIWGLELGTGKLVQYTNAVTGCMMPTVLRGEDGDDRVVYTGFWKGSFDLYVSDRSEPVAASETAAKGPAATERLTEYQPDIQVTLDSANEERYKRSKLFLEDAYGSVGVTSDQLVLGYAQLVFSDYLGDRRLLATLSSVDTFSNFDFLYLDLSRRWNWSAELFDRRYYFLGRDNRTGLLRRGSAIYRETGTIASYIYPFDTYHRVEAGGGYILRKYDFQQVIRDESGNIVYRIDPRSDNYPVSTRPTAQSVAGAGGCRASTVTTPGAAARCRRASTSISASTSSSPSAPASPFVRSAASRTAASRGSTAWAVSTPCAASTTGPLSATAPSSPIWNSGFRWSTLSSGRSSTSVVSAGGSSWTTAEPGRTTPARATSSALPIAQRPPP